MEGQESFNEDTVGFVGSLFFTKLDCRSDGVKWTVLAI
jgi:hypothetical protein